MYNNIKIDIQEFIRYHPGGPDILRHYINKDITEIIDVLHPNITKVHDILKKLSKNTVLIKDTKYIQLKNKILQQEPDIFVFDNFYIIREVIISVCCYFFHILFLIFNPYMSCIIYALGINRTLYIGHDTTHKNVSKYVQNMCQYVLLLYPFSLTRWYDRHITHHAMTNVKNIDTDHKSHKMVAKCRKILCYVLTDTISSYTTLTLGFVLHLYAWRLSGIIYAIRKHCYIEVLFFAIHYLSIIYFLSVFNIQIYTYIYVITIGQFIGGGFMALVNILSHNGSIPYLSSSDKLDNFVELQLKTTRDLSGSNIFQYFAGGLHLQVEHHIFPFVSRNKLYKLRKYIIEYCLDNKLKFNECSFLDAIPLYFNGTPNVDDLLQDA